MRNIGVCLDGRERGHGQMRLSIGVAAPETINSFQRQSWPNSEINLNYQLQCSSLQFLAP